VVFGMDLSCLFLGNVVLVAVDSLAVDLACHYFLVAVVDDDA